MHELEKRELDSEILLVSAQDKVDVMLKAYKQGALGYFEKHKEILSELEKCIQWILLMSNDFRYPIERNEFRKIWLKQK
jgi:DNA-binding NtrC family response regulator